MQKCTSTISKYIEKSFQTLLLRLGNNLPNHIKLAESKQICCKFLKTLLYKLSHKYFKFVFNIKVIRHLCISLVSTCLSLVQGDFKLNEACEILL